MDIQNDTTSSDRPRSAPIAWTNVTEDISGGVDMRDDVELILGKDKCEYWLVDEKYPSCYASDIAYTNCGGDKTKCPTILEALE